MSRHHSLIFILLLLIFTISACGSEPTPATEKPLPTTPIPAPVSIDTPTPDPCAPEKIAVEVEKVHKLMREFDDASMLASNTPVEQLNPSIADLQRIRRDAEDQVVPVCLANLKKYQLEHMNSVINILMAFMSGIDQETLNQSVILARQQHDQYSLELAAILGLDVIPAPTMAPTDEVPAAFSTPTATGPFVTNPGPTAVNLRAQPNLSANTLGIMAIGASAAVLGRTADALWYQIEFPDQPGKTAWVYVSLVQISDPMVDLPVLTPTP